jgi:hypothetical protein
VLDDDHDSLRVSRFYRHVGSVNVVYILEFCEYFQPDLPSVEPPLWSEFLATDPEVRVLFLALPDFLRSSGSRTDTTQSREYN